jgi:L-fuculose-phosphate aldolase
MDVDEIRFKVAASRRILFRADLDRDDVAGQVTARAQGEDAFWTTPLELLDETVPEHVVKLPFERAISNGSKLIDVDGSLPVTTASNWVEAIYANRPDVDCIIHTHAPYIGAVATTGGVVQMFNNRTVMFYGEQAFYDDDGTNTDSADRIVAALGAKSVLIMRNHGAVIVAESVERATVQAVMLEKAARFHVLGASVGGTPFPDNPAFLTRKVPHRANLQLLWDAHLRRLRRTDPDLFERADAASAHA